MIFAEVRVFTASFSLVLLYASMLMGQSMEVDLLEMDRNMKVRFYEKEKGELPFTYMLLGLSRRVSFLGPTPDLRKLHREYDMETGLVYDFLVCGDYGFVRRESRDRGYYFYSERDMQIPGMDIKI